MGWSNCGITVGGIVPVLAIAGCRCEDLLGITTTAYYRGPWSWGWKHPYLLLRGASPLENKSLRKKIDWRITGFSPRIIENSRFVFCLFAKAVCWNMQIWIIHTQTQPPQHPNDPVAPIEDRYQVSSWQYADYQLGRHAVESDYPSMTGWWVVCFFPLLQTNWKENHMIRWCHNW